NQHEAGGLEEVPEDRPGGEILHQGRVSAADTGSGNFFPGPWVRGGASQSAAEDTPSGGGGGIAAQASTNASSPAPSAHQPAPVTLRARAPGCARAAVARAASHGTARRATRSRVGDGK